VREIIDTIINNPILVMLITSPIFLLIAGAIYQSLMKIFLSEKNIHLLSVAIDRFIDKLEKKDSASAKLTRTKLISICTEIIEKLKEDVNLNK
jgi:hypothetical protein